MQSQLAPPEGTNPLVVITMNDNRGRHSYPKGVNAFSLQLGEPGCQKKHSGFSIKDTGDYHTLRTKEKSKQTPQALDTTTLSNYVFEEQSMTHRSMDVICF